MGAVSFYPPTSVPTSSVWKCPFSQRLTTDYIVQFEFFGLSDRWDGYQDSFILHFFLLKGHLHFFFCWVACLYISRIYMGFLVFSFFIFWSFLSIKPLSMIKLQFFFQFVVWFCRIFMVFFFVVLEEFFCMRLGLLLFLLPQDFEPVLEKLSLFPRYWRIHSCFLIMLVWFHF